MVKPTTVHQELGYLRRILNVAVRKKLLPSNPCSGVEFPVSVKGLFRPHYVSWSEQQRIEQHAPAYLQNVVRIITETGLRVYKELLSMKKEQVDLAECSCLDSRFQNAQRCWRTPADETRSCKHFESQIALSGNGAYLVPERAKCQRAFQVHLADCMATHSKESEDSVFQNLRSPVDIRHPLKRGRRCGRVGHSAASAR